MSKPTWTQVFSTAFPERRRERKSPPRAWEWLIAAGAAVLVIVFTVRTRSAFSIVAVAMVTVGVVRMVLRQRGARSGSAPPGPVGGAG